ncbi:MAG TPA: nitroreductase/quinone reductase family protein [Chloroflexia bacterium]|nr:nitroreductase/quinone reductase family protein [Chloroflexia bacterium]
MAKGNYARWLYKGQHPHLIAKMYMKLWSAVAYTGIAQNYLVSLEVIGRKTGRILSLPVVIAVVSGQRYLVSMLGDNAQWVQNVRAAGGSAFIRAGGRKEVLLEEVPAEERAPILKVYLKRAPGARPHIPVSKDAPLADFEKVAADFPVFRIVSKQAI